MQPRAQPNGIPEAGKQAVTAQGGAEGSNLLCWLADWHDASDQGCAGAGSSVAQSDVSWRCIKARDQIGIPARLHLASARGMLHKYPCMLRMADECNAAHTRHLPPLQATAEEPRLCSDMLTR